MIFLFIVNKTANINQCAHVCDGRVDIYREPKGSAFVNDISLIYIVFVLVDLNLFVINFLNVNSRYLLCVFELRAIVNC